MIEISKFSDEFAVLDCGSVITFRNNASCCFALNIDKLDTINILISFHTDNSGKKDLSRSVCEADNSIVIKCTNFDNPMGTGTAEPIKILKYRSKTIFLNFWVFLLGNTTLKRVDYCFYIKKKKKQ